MEFYRKKDDEDLLKKNTKFNKFYRNGFCLIYKFRTVSAGTCLGDYEYSITF